MKKWIIAIFVILLVVFFGTWPLSILGKLLEWLATAIKWLAKILDFFNWNGLITSWGF